MPNSLNQTEAIIQKSMQICYDSELRRTCRKGQWIMKHLLYIEIDRKKAQHIKECGSFMSSISRNINK
jgi:hypothetical protein